ncbi:MAG: hypothetical protein COZ18_11700 [Flexibacter sp. CG_4_10_14_3_um_filter_32_15]|nr:MAG: hypothetical protein COZ18_11700 [Flexibacter sp. CG_4_10_14_3_um_filter_32_15]
MKKSLFLLLFFVFGAIYSASAQDSVALILKAIDELRSQQRQLQQQNQDFVRRYQTLSNQRQQDSIKVLALTDSLRRRSTQINLLSSDLGLYKETVEKNDAIVKGVSRRVELTDEARYKMVRTNLIHSADFFEVLNDRLNTLYAINQVESYRTMLNSLNNPADETLGFSYNDKVMQLMEKKLISKRDKGGQKILNIANMLLQDPVVSNIASATPVVNIATSVLGFVSGIAAQRKDIDEKEVQEFKNELEKYTAYYSKLNVVNSRFANNIDNYQVQTTNLHDKLTEYVNLQAKGLKFDVKLKEPEGNATNGEYLLTVFRTYNKSSVTAYFDKLEKEFDKGGKVDYSKLMMKYPHIMEANKKIEDVIYLYKEFDYLYGQYISMIDENSRNTIVILQGAVEQNLSSEPAKVKAQIEILKNKKTEAVTGIRRAVNLPRLKDIVNTLDSYYPAL